MFVVCVRSVQDEDAKREDDASGWPCRRFLGHEEIAEDTKEAQYF